MVFIGTYRMPNDKIEEWMKCFSDMTSKPLPSCIKKWETFSCYDGDKSKGYNLIFTEEGKADEAFVEISRLISPFCQIEGSSWKLEPATGVTDTLKVIGKSK